MPDAPWIDDCLCGPGEDEEAIDWGDDDDDIDWGDDDDDAIDWGDDKPKDEPKKDDEPAVDWGDDDDDEIDWGDDDDDAIDWGDDSAEQAPAAQKAAAPEDKPPATAMSEAVEEPADWGETAETIDWGNSSATPAAASTSSATAPAAPAAVAWTAPVLRDVIADLEFADDAYHFLFASAGPKHVLWVSATPLPGVAAEAAEAEVPGATVVTGQVAWNEDDDLPVFDGGGDALLAALTGPLAAEVPVLATSRVEGAGGGGSSANKLEDLIRADAAAGALLARLDAAGPKSADARAAIAKAMERLANQGVARAQLVEKMTARPDPSHVKEAAALMQQLPGLRAKVVEAQTAGARVLGKVSKIRGQLRDALEASTGDLAVAWAEAKEGEMPDFLVAAAGEELPAPTGDAMGALTTLAEAYNAIAKAMPKFKMSGKSKTIVDFLPDDFPADAAAIVASYGAAQQDGWDAKASSLANPATMALKATVETQRQFRQWDEWKANFPPQQQANLDANTAAIGELIDAMLSAWAGAVGG